MATHSTHQCEKYWLWLQTSKSKKGILKTRKVQSQYVVTEYAENFGNKKKKKRKKENEKAGELEE